MLRNATADDIQFVVANMRPEDAKELWLASGKSAAEAVAALGEHEYVAFTICAPVVRSGIYTATDEVFEPVCIFGATLHDGTAEMFRFATPRWPEVVREAVKIGRRVMLPLFKQAGVKQLLAVSLANSDTRWLTLFGAKKVGGFVDGKGHHFETFSVDFTGRIVTENDLIGALKRVWQAA